MTTDTVRHPSDIDATPYTIVGAGAIGGTLACHLARTGHPVTVVDNDPDHAHAIARRGITVANGQQRITAAPAAALTPEDPHAPETIGRVLLAVKAQATDAAMTWITPRLTRDGFVVSLQNGLNEDTIAAYVGTDRTVGAFVNLFADVVEPGVIRDGGRGALVVGEIDGRVSSRVESVVSDLQAWGPAQASDNMTGFLWAKLGFGAMLTATALADAPMADLIDRHHPLMHALAREVFTVAETLGVALEPFDAFHPNAYAPSGSTAEAAAATDALMAWLRTQPKDRSGIWRDIAVRKRRTEVPAHYKAVLDTAARLDVPTPLLEALLQQIAELEDGAPMSEQRLHRLAEVVL